MLRTPQGVATSLEVDAPSDTLGFVGPPDAALAAVEQGFVVVAAVGGPPADPVEPSADAAVPAIDAVPADPAAWTSLLSPVVDAAELVPRIAGRLADRPSFFLDFDGVLSRIVDDPDAARLTASAKKALPRLMEVGPVAIVSGRGLDDVADRIGIDGLAYAGSHGFETIGWDGNRTEHPGGLDAERVLEEAAERLDDVAIEGVQVERKRFAVAVHTRRARNDAARRIAGTATAALAQELGLELTVGKEVHEVRPDVGWNKGGVVSDLLPPDTIPVYVGDDTTDEDALAMVRRLGGIGIHVGEDLHPAQTWARLRLDDPAAVGRFLGELATDLGGS